MSHYVTEERETTRGNGAGFTICSHPRFREEANIGA